jgi:type II secretory pathway pseudopilin PulG
LTETGLISTTAISAAATSASVIYSTTARTSVAYRVIGYIESTQATAGTWATTPSTIQGCGGQALTAMSSLGYGQVWSNPTRVAGTTYYNTSGKPRFVIALVQPSGGSSSAAQWTVAGVSLGGAFATSVPTGLYMSIPVIVPPGQSYLFTVTSGILGNWSELG